MTGIDRDWNDVVSFFLEKDPFRLVIRGQSLLEEALNQGIDGALPAGSPPELKRLNFAARLALAQALELITPDLAHAMKGLARIRNEFAHGLGDDITEAHAKATAEMIAPFLDEEIDGYGFANADVMR